MCACVPAATAAKKEKYLTLRPAASAVHLSGEGHSLSVESPRPVYSVVALSAVRALCAANGTVMVPNTK
ncbi:hypothetical protein GCM10009820_03550 [Leifsonia soli]